MRFYNLQARRMPACCQRCRRQLSGNLSLTNISHRRPGWKIRCLFSLLPGSLPSWGRPEGCWSWWWFLEQSTGVEVNHALGFGSWKGKLGGLQFKSILSRNESLISVALKSKVSEWLWSFPSLYFRKGNRYINLARTFTATRYPQTVVDSVPRHASSLPWNEPAFPKSFCEYFFVLYFFLLIYLFHLQQGCRVPPRTRKVGEWWTTTSVPPSYS